MPKNIEKIDINAEEEKDKKENQNCEKKELTPEQLEKYSQEQKQAQIKLDEIFKELDPIKIDDYSGINPEEFEKDHDENGHLDFIHAGANLRARNYKIDECDRNKTRQIAGKIIPTILTTTASIAGLASMQLYTLFQTNERKFFRNSLINLISCFGFFSEPLEPVKIADSEYSEISRGPMKAVPEGWNTWDVIEIKGPKTCGELIDEFKNKYDVDVDMLVGNGETFLNLMLGKKKEKMEMKIEELYEQSKKKKIEKNYLLIQVLGTIPEGKIGDKTFKGISAYIPPIKYYFK